MQTTMREQPMKQHVAMARAGIDFVPVPARTMPDLYTAIATTSPTRMTQFRWTMREHMFSANHEEVADTARFYGLFVTCENMGGHFIRRYHYTATGPAESMRKFLAWIIGNGAAENGVAKW